MTDIRPMQNRARSVFRGDEAGDFVLWVNNMWNSLTAEERKAATMECRPCEKDGYAMVGFEWESRSR